MTRLEKIEQEVFDEGISIYNYKLSDAKKAACFLSEDDNAIVLDRHSIQSSAEETIILAEELAHFETGSVYLLAAGCNMPLDRLRRGKLEETAKRATYEKLLPPGAIQVAIRECAGNLTELPEYLETTPDFLGKALEYYACKGVEFDWPECECC